MTFFLLLLFAHVVADFPLQTNWIFTQKTKGAMGGVWHSAVVALCTLTAVLPWLIVAPWRVLPVVGALTAVHYVQDSVKIFCWEKRRYPLLLGYGGDQVVHGGMPLGAPVSAWQVAWYSPPLIVCGIFLVGMTWCWDTTVHILRVRRGYRGVLRRDYAGMVVRGVVGCVMLWLAVHVGGGVLL